MPLSQANVPDADFPAPETGLLEQPLLRLGPAGPEGRRGASDAAGRLVGACQTRPGPWWLRWLGPGTDIFEARDQPLVFSIRPAFPLLGRQVVRDADGELIGTTSRRQVNDRWGRALLLHRAQPDGQGGQFVGPGGEVVARWALRDGETVLELDPAWHLGPFERMLVLAAVIGRCP